jgi:quercetin dioxygenase-like cupin family protein
VIPPGVSVPLHSHPDTENFFVISGEVQALRQGAQGYEWIVAKAGDHLHVPAVHTMAGATFPTRLWSHFGLDRA